MDRLAETIRKLLPPAEARLSSIWTESIDVDMPVEVLVGSQSGELVIGVSAPSQGFTTRVMPTFHRARLRLVADETQDGQ